MRRSAAFWGFESLPKPPGNKKPPRSADLRGSKHHLRSGRDSNPQVLSDARFRGECNSRSATAPNTNNKARIVSGFAVTTRAHRTIPRPRPDHHFTSNFTRGTRIELRSPIGDPRRIRAKPQETFQTIGAPGFEPGTSATRTQRSTGLSHAPDLQPHHRPGRGSVPQKNVQPPKQCSRSERAPADHSMSGIRPEGDRGRCQSTAADQPKRKVAIATPRGFYNPTTNNSDDSNTDGVGFDPKGIEDGATHRRRSAQAEGRDSDPAWVP